MLNLIVESFDKLGHPNVFHSFEASEQQLPIANFYFIINNSKRVPRRSLFG